MPEVCVSNELLVWIPQHLPAEDPVPLRLHLCEDKLLMTVSPGTDSIDAEAARAAVATLCQYFEQHKIIHRVMSEGSEGTLIDTIMIPLPRRC
jgi:hypothetical protein